MKLLLSCLLGLTVFCTYAQEIVTPGKIPGTRLVTTPRSQSIHSPLSKSYMYHTPTASKQVLFTIQIDEYKNGVKQRNSELVWQNILKKEQRQRFMIIPENINDSTLRVSIGFASMEIHKYRHNKPGYVYKWKNYEKASEEKLGESIPVMLFYEDHIDSGYLEKELSQVIVTDEISSATDISQVFDKLRTYYILSYTLQE
jgi:hypothetical protein